MRQFLGNLLIKAKDSSLVNLSKQLEYLMKSSNTSSWESGQIKQSSCENKLGREVLITSSTRELVELYWTNRKRFSGGYEGFPARAL